MPTNERPSEEQRKELQDYYLERYKRIKDERRIILNTLIGLSGSCVVLSITFLEKIAPYKRLVALIVLAWCLFGLAILVSVFGLMKMIHQSQKFQRKLEHALNDPGYSGEELFGPIRFSAPRWTQIYQAPEYLSGFAFGLGVLLIATFAIANLVMK
jgi:hypothetical protein